MFNLIKSKVALFIYKKILQKLSILSPTESMGIRI